MKRLYILFFCACLSWPLWAQQNDSNVVFTDPNFKWKIEVPQGFEQVEPEVWDLQRGAVGDSTLHSETIVAFKANDYNYLEASWQPFDEEKQGDYRLHFLATSDQLYQTFKEHLPDAKINKASSSQLIGNVIFQKYVLTMELPNGVVIRSHMFGRLFDNREFTANIFYVTDTSGATLLKAWLDSSFE